MRECIGDVAEFDGDFARFGTQDMGSSKSGTTDLRDFLV
jgi:hypothetical protein